MILKDMLADGSDYEVSLSKLTQRPIKDILGYLTNEFGDVTFKLTEIIFEDGTKLGVEGEHDLPYVVEYRRESSPLPNEETLEDLYHQNQDNDE